MGSNPTEECSISLAVPFTGLRTGSPGFAIRGGDLPPAEQLRLANPILKKLEFQDLLVIDRSDRWADQDQAELANFSLQYAAPLFPED